MTNWWSVAPVYCIYLNYILSYVSYYDGFTPVSDALFGNVVKPAQRIWRHVVPVRFFNVLLFQFSHWILFLLHELYRRGLYGVRNKFLWAFLVPSFYFVQAGRKNLDNMAKYVTKCPLSLHWCTTQLRASQGLYIEEPLYQISSKSFTKYGNYGYKFFQAFK
jgi:hypothetical protein